MRITGLFILTLFIVGCEQKDNSHPNQSVPNILFIMADDLSYADLGCCGSTYARTPNLDQLAKKGMKFTQFYSASPVCTPTGAAMLTGKYPIRFNIIKYFGNPEHYFTSESTTIPDLLKSKGYYSATIGKWHLDGLDTSDIDARQNGLLARPGPLEHGFDYYLGALRYGLKKERRLFKDAGKTLVENDQYLPPDSAQWTDINIDYSIRAMEQCL
ncbi:MAG: sulfatase-like hydrolase/transferase [Bacteroidota bacterium]